MRPNKPQYVIPGPGRRGVWRTRIDGKYHYLTGVDRYQRPLAGSGPDAIPVAAWDWLNGLRSAARREAATDLTVYYLALAYLQWGEGEVVAGRLSAGQWRGIRARLRLFWDFPGVAEVRASALGVETLAAFFDYLRSAGYSAHYIAGVGRTIRALYRWAARPVPGRSPVRYLAANPVEGYRFPRAAASRELVESADVRRFLRWAWSKALKAPGRSKRFDRLYLLMVQFMRLTGCRPGEAAGLRWSHWDRAAGRIVLQEHKTAKSTGRARVVYVTAPVSRLLRTVEALEGRHPDFVFTHRRGVGAESRGHLCADAGEPWPSGSAASAKLRAIRSAAIGAGVPGIAATGPKRLTAYQARHGYASRAVDLDLTIEQTAELLGNTAAVTASVYVHSIDAGAKRRAEELARRRGKGGG